MSYDVHEAFSFDSFEQQLLFWDDFEGDALKDLWAKNGAGAGSDAIVVDAQTGGIVRLTTGADDNGDHRIDWGNIRSLHVDQKVVMEYTLTLSAVTSVHFIGALRFDADNVIRFWFDTDQGHSNWRLSTKNGGVETNSDSGVSPDTDKHTFRVETSASSVSFYIDGVLVGTNTTNIPSDAADYLQPYLRNETRTTANRNADIDYCYVRQERG